MSESSRAVFLSYASQDAAAAARLSEALRAAGIEVWFDQTALRGGDAWDAMIRRQIRSCALFIAIISHNTRARTEGYFRLEWKLAVDRSHLIAASRTFLLPVAVDDVGQDDEAIPERFRELQWTRLPGGDATQVFVARVAQLLAPEPAPATAVTQAADPAAAAPAVATRRSPIRPAWMLVGAAVAACLAAGYYLWPKARPGAVGVASQAVMAPVTATPATPIPVEATFNPPPHSLAVLPFVNMSGDPKQEYFSDGLTEEILNALARIDELHVVARTSAFSFKGKDTDIGTIARKLNVGAILEGSVRRSANTVRITTQLIDASSGYHLWSETYDRNLGDVLKLETDIATAVAGALKVTLLEGQAEKIEVGGTRNPQALNAFLRGSKSLESLHAPADAERMFADFDEAVRLDPQYAIAVAARSIAWSARADFATSPTQIQEFLARAEADARHAIALAPGLSDGHGALGAYFSRILQPAPAAEEYARAVQLNPGNAYALAAAGDTAVWVGRTDQGLAALRHAATLDPLSANIQRQLGLALYLARRYDEAIAAFDAAHTLDPGSPEIAAMRGLTYYSMGNLEAARRACEIESDDPWIQTCRAILYEKLGRHVDTRTALEAVQSKLGDAAAYQYAQIYGQWGDVPTALTWLEKALRLRDGDLSFIKVDPLMDPLRGEPRFQAVLRTLKFPE